MHGFLKQKMRKIKIQKLDFEVKETSTLLKLEAKKKTGNPAIIEELINLVGFHRREDKSKYWAKFDRLEKTPEELEDDPECIANALFEKKISIKDSDKITFVYKFKEQNFKLKEVVLHTLSDYDHLLLHAKAENAITAEQLTTLSSWRKDPANWTP